MAQLRVKAKLSGFSLWELLLVLSLIGLLCFSLWPGYKASLDKTKLDALTNSMKNAINHGKNQSLLLQKTVYLEPVDNWQKGARLIVDNQILTLWQWQAAPFTMSWHGFNQSDRMQFNWDLAQAVSNGRFVVKYHGVEVRRLIVNRIGRVIAD